MMNMNLFKQHRQMAINHLHLWWNQRLSLYPTPLFRKLQKPTRALTPHLPRIQLSMQMRQSSLVLPASPQNHCHITPTARDISPRKVYNSAGPSILDRHSPPTFTGAIKLIVSPTRKPKTQIKLREKGKDKPDATTKKINIATMENHPKNKISDSHLNQQNEKDEKLSSCYRALNES